MPDQFGNLYESMGDNDDNVDVVDDDDDDNLDEFYNP